MKKKILLIPKNPYIFRGIFNLELLNLSKDFEIYIVFCHPVLEKNSKYKIIFLNWLRYLKKKKIIKFYLLLNCENYFDIKQTLLLNKKIKKLINFIKKNHIESIIFFSKNIYWEEMLFQIFKKKLKIFGFLLSAPSGIDIFNKLEDFISSYRKKKYLNSNYFQYLNDNEDAFNKFKNFNIPIYKKKNINFFKDKIIVIICKFINFFFLPLSYGVFIFRPYFMKKLDVNFKNIKHIFTYNKSLNYLLKKILINKTINQVNLNSSINKNCIKNNSYKWIFFLQNNSNSVLNECTNIIIELKKLKKIKYLYIKAPIDWPVNSLCQNFINNLKKNLINFKIINPLEFIDYKKYYGIISPPSTVHFESAISNSYIKRIGLISDNFTISPALYQLYKKEKNILWKINNMQKLQKYLSDSLIIKNSDKSFSNYLNNFFK